MIHKQLIVAFTVTTALASLFAPLSNAASPLPLEGSWMRSCHLADASDPESHYDIITLQFYSDNFSSDIKNYSDASCKIPFKYAPNPTASGTFTLGNSFINSKENTVTEIDTLITQFNGSPFEIIQYEVFLIQDNKLYFSIEAADDVLPNADSRISEIDFSTYFSPI